MSCCLDAVLNVPVFLQGNFRSLLPSRSLYQKPRWCIIHSALHFLKILSLSVCTHLLNSSQNTRSKWFIQEKLRSGMISWLNLSQSTIVRNPISPSADEEASRWSLPPVSCNTSRRITLQSCRPPRALSSSPCPGFKMANLWLEKSISSSLPRSIPMSCGFPPLAQAPFFSSFFLFLRTRRSHQTCCPLFRSEGSEGLSPQTAASTQECGAFTAGSRARPLLYRLVRFCVVTDL